jgi:hypothetical protein
VRVPDECQGFEIRRGMEGGDFWDTGGGWMPPYPICTQRKETLWSGLLEEREKIMIRMA